MKASEHIKSCAEAFLFANFPTPHTDSQVNRAMWKFLLEQVDEFDSRLSKLERREDDDGQVIGETEHGDMVFGVEREVPRVHIGHRDSLERFGTGHPSERCCKLCGRPTFDKPDSYQDAAGQPYCSKEHHDAHKTQTHCAVTQGGVPVVITGPKTVAPLKSAYEPEPEGSEDL